MNETIEIKKTAEEIKQEMWELGWAYPFHPYDKLFVRFFGNDEKRLEKPEVKTWKEAREMVG